MQLVSFFSSSSRINYKDARKGFPLYTEKGSEKVGNPPVTDVLL